MNITTLAIVTVFVLLAACVLAAGVFEGNKEDRDRMDSFRKGKH